MNTSLIFFRSGKAPTIFFFAQYFMNFRYFLRFFSPLISSFWYPIGHPRIDHLVNTEHDAINLVLHVLCIGRKKQRGVLQRQSRRSSQKSANILQPRSTELANTPVWATFQESDGSWSHLTGMSLASLCQQEGKDKGWAEEGQGFYFFFVLVSSLVNKNIFCCCCC